MSIEINWYYHRRSWTSAKRAQEFLSSKDVDQPEFILASKNKFNREETLNLLKDADTVLVAKGKKLLRFSMKDVDEDALAKAVLGRSGNLRAPAMQVGTSFIVGFHADGYQELFG